MQVNFLILPVNQFEGMKFWWIFRLIFCTVVSLWQFFASQRNTRISLIWDLNRFIIKFYTLKVWNRSVHGWIFMVFDWTLKNKIYDISRKRNLDNIEVTISNTKIERKSEARFLGVIVDEKLKWTKHISVLKSKMTKYLGIVYKLKFIIPLKARLLIYQSFVHSHLNFCSSVWGFAAKSAPSKKPDTVHGQPVRRQVVHG